MNNDEQCKLDCLVAAILAAGRLAARETPMQGLNQPETPLSAFQRSLMELRANGGAAGAWMAAKR